MGNLICWRKEDSCLRSSGQAVFMWRASVCARKCIANCKWDRHCLFYYKPLSHKIWVMLNMSDFVSLSCYKLIQILVFHCGCVHVCIVLLDPLWVCKCKPYCSDLCRTSNFNLLFFIFSVPFFPGVWTRVLIHWWEFWQGADHFDGSQLCHTR